MSRARILVVDDEPNMRTTLSDILEDEGYHVDTADSGEAAVEQANTTLYDIILMDVRMPGIDGVEAFRRIRARQEDVRVIIMSAYTTDDLKEVALEEGAIAFLPKPLDIESVLRVIGDTRDTTILVVEDDEGVASAMTSRLKEKGYRVQKTSYPSQALEMAEQVQFDVIFIDVGLPVMDGLSLYLAIKEITPASVAIMMSGREAEMEALAREAVRRTAYAVVRKPLDLDYVLDLLDKLRGQRVTGALRKPIANEVS